MRKINILVFFLLAIYSISGCATKLSPEARSIRVITKTEMVENCIYLGQLNSSSMLGDSFTGVGFESAMNELKNNAAKIGADALFIQIISNTVGGTRMIGDAYKCKK